nr:unnamed protein product [Callosobruchus chinensis]
MKIGEKTKDRGQGTTNKCKLQKYKPKQWELKNVSTTNPIHSFADDSTLHAGIISNRPISVVELERRRLATAASLSKDLEAITAWGCKNMVEFNAFKIQYFTLSNKRCPSEHSVLMNNQALPRSHSIKLLGVSITESLI